MDQYEEAYIQAEHHFDMQEEKPIPEPPKDELNEEEKKKRKQIMDAQLKCK